MHSSRVFLSHPAQQIVRLFGADSPLFLENRFLIKAKNGLFLFLGNSLASH